MIKTMMITMIVMMTTIKVVECDDYDYDHGGSNKKVDDDDFLMSGLGMISEALALLVMPVLVCPRLSCRT